MKLLALTVLTIALAGCATPRSQLAEYEAWRAAARPAAATGSAWEAYYKESYARLQALPSFDGRADLMEIASDMIVLSHAYKTGEITQHMFEGAQRNAEAQASRVTEQRNAARDRAMAAAFASGAIKLNTVPAQAYQVPVQKQINCTSQAVYNTVQTNCR